MKKSLLRKIVATTMTLSVIAVQVSPIGILTKEVKAVTNFPTWNRLENKPTLRFAVLSDTHVGPNKPLENERLGNVFSALYQIDPNIDAISIVGDITDSGSQSEYDTFKKIIDSNKKPDTDLVISMGNHEGNTASRFTAATGRQPKENLNINGYHFITLSPRSTPITNGGNRYNLDEQWLKEQLDAATAEDPTKPIFVFMHHGIKDTAYGTDEWNTPDLQELFKKYPQVVHFSGHSHYPLNDPRSINQKDFTAMNTSTNSYFELESGMMYGTIPPNAKNASQIMVLDVEGTKVKVKKLDLLSGQYIGEDWVFDTANGKSGFSYTDARIEKSPSPYFDNSSMVKIDEVKDNSCTLTIDQAKIDDVKGDNSDEIVHSYRYDFINKKSGKVEKSYKIWSEYYFLPMSKTLTQTFAGLKVGTEYDVTVTALNSYKKESANKLVGTFKTTGGVTPPTEEELNKPVEPAEMMQVNFEDGTAKDLSKSNHNFVAMGNPEVIYDETLNKNVAQFNGASAFKYQFSDDDYSKIKKNVTLESVFKLEKSDSAQDVFANTESAGLSFETTKISGDDEYANLEFWVRTKPVGTTGTGSYTVISGRVKYGEYNHAMATYDGKSVKLYINGELENSKDIAGEIYHPTGAAKAYFIGSDTNSSGNIQAPMKGRVSVARLYSRTLTELDAYKLNKKEIVDRNNKKDILLKDINNVDGKTGTEIKMPIETTMLPKDKEIRSGEMVFDIPEGLEVKSVELNQVAINTSNYDYNVTEGKLRIALGNVDGTNVTVDSTTGVKNIGTITLAVKGDKTDGDTVTVKANNFTFRCNNNEDITYGVDKAISKITFVKKEVIQAFPRELYVSTGADVIPQGYKAYAIEFVGVDKSSKVATSNGVDIYYNPDFTAKNGKTTYITLVKDTVSLEDLSKIENYKIVKEKPELKDTISFGDLSNDGIDAQDALGVVTSWLRKTETNNKGMLTLNVSGDGAINTRDAIEIVDKFVKGKDFSIISK